VFLIAGCKKENVNTTENGISGKFALGLASNLKSGKVAESDNLFVLDTIKSSRSFYFILTNVGEEDITDVLISTDNSGFKVTPSTIKTLSGTKSNNSPSLVQIISLDVVHGTRINGVGSTDLLNMGDNTCNLNIQGKTFDGKDNVSVSLKGSIKVYAKVMAVSLYQGTQPYDMTKPTGKIIGGWFDVSQMFNFNYSTNIPIVIKNIGNVRIKLIMDNFDANHTVIQNATLNPKDTLVLKLSAQNSAWAANGMIQLNSDGTIFDQKKLSLGNDGNGYFGVMYNGTYYPTPIDSTQN